jgi:lipid-binding SYLF domain-containing protein
MQRRTWIATCLVTVASLVHGAGIAHAETGAQLDAAASAVLDDLIKRNEAARSLSKRAVGVLVFPKITKAGVMVGGQYGEGVLKRNGKTVAYYSSTAASYGLQAGVQTFSYVLFLMSDAALAQIDKNQGLEVGVGPSLVVVDEGMAKTMTTTTTKDDIYAFVFGQKGLMAGVGLQGTKVTRIQK